MAVRAVNGFVGPDGTNPTLTVYGAIPRLGLFTNFRYLPQTNAQLQLKGLLKP